MFVICFVINNLKGERYLWAVTTIRILTTCKRTARINSRIFRCWILAALPFRFPAHPFIRILTIEPYRFLSAFGKPTIVGLLIPKWIRFTSRIAVVRRRRWICNGGGRINCLTGDNFRMMPIMIGTIVCITMMYIQFCCWIINYIWAQPRMIFKLFRVDRWKKRENRMLIGFCSFLKTIFRFFLFGF